ncbi:MAG: carboxypeptidase regulatory-like domain-containing protein [Chitinophagaceae bacterium]|nr:MAG: carboxypeptidase regulatory-like domain-containing protein [Chitinophagaceae bacterium]
MSTAENAGNKCKIERTAMNTQDSLNQQVVAEILDKYGWLSKKQISAKANNAFFYVIQHAPLAYQAKYAKLIDVAFKNKEISNAEYAFFVDRFKSKQGMAQIYGTQAEGDNLGNSYLYPIKNWHTVNKSRAQLKLPPLDLAKTPEYIRYPKVLEGDSIVLIGHVFDKTNQPIANAQVYLDNLILGQSNEKGLFIIGMKRPAEGSKITVKAKDKNNTTSIKGLKDFYNIYMQF